MNQAWNSVIAKKRGDPLKSRMPDEFEVSFANQIFCYFLVINNKAEVFPRLLV